MSLSDIEKTKESWDKQMRNFFEKYEVVQDVHKKKNKQVTDAKNKEETKARNAEKKEFERAQREAEATIPVGFPDGRSITVTVPMSSATIGNLRKLIAVKLGFRIFKSVNIQLSFNGRVISDNPRRLLYGLQIADGSSLGGELINKSKGKKNTDGYGGSTAVNGVMDEEESEEENETVDEECGEP